MYRQITSDNGQSKDWVFSPEGRFSCILSPKKRKWTRYNDFLLAAREENRESIHSVLSFCGKFTMDGDAVDCELYDGVHNFSQGRIQLRGRIKNDRLEIKWTRRNEESEIEKSVVSVWRRIIHNPKP